MIKKFKITVSYSDDRGRSVVLPAYSSGDAICAFLLTLGLSDLDGIKDISAVEE